MPGTCLAVALQTDQQVSRGPLHLPLSLVLTQGWLVSSVPDANDELSLEISLGSGPVQPS